MIIKHYLDSFDIFGGVDAPRFQGVASMLKTDFDTAQVEGVALGGSFFAFSAAVSAANYLSAPNPQQAFADAICDAIQNLISSDFEILGVTMEVIDNTLNWDFKKFSFAVSAESSNYAGVTQLPSAGALLFTGNNDYFLNFSLTSTRVTGGVTYAPQFQSHQQNFAAAGFVL